MKYHTLNLTDVWNPVLLPSYHSQISNHLLQLHLSKKTTQPRFIQTLDIYQIAILLLLFNIYLSFENELGCV